MNAFRFGVIAGAIIVGTYVLAMPSFRSTDLIAWGLAGCFVAAGGVLGGAIVLAVTHAVKSPIAMARAVPFLTPLSLLVLVPHGLDHWRAHGLLARADSARGVVTRTWVRDGAAVEVNWIVSDSVLSMSDRTRRATVHLRVNDSVLVFFDPTDPSRATVGHLGPDWTNTFGPLTALWIIGGILFLGYGLHASPVGVPRTWCGPLRFLRAYVGAAVVADIGATVAFMLSSPMDDPRDEVVDLFWFSLFFGAIVSLIYTLVLGGVAFLVLRQRRWTSVAAYATCGVVLGAVGALATVGLSGAAVGGVAGVLAALTFRGLFHWGGQPPTPKPAA